MPFTMNFEQGSAFGSKEYVFLLASKGISQSMDKRARWKDNALIERWFQALKSECLKADGFTIRVATTRRKNGT